MTIPYVCINCSDCWWPRTLLSCSYHWLPCPLPFFLWILFSYSNFVALFCLCPNEFNKGSPVYFGFEIIHWVLMGSPMSILLQTMPSPPQESVSSPYLAGWSRNPWTTICPLPLLLTRSVQIVKITVNHVSNGCVMLRRKYFIVLLPIFCLLQCFCTLCFNVPWALEGVIYISHLGMSIQLTLSTSSNHGPSMSLPFTEMTS